ncbi:MAG: hypothetical protein EBV28_07115, partial [Betaproteobacteria bacterium]|nr:hypothetical protein [Betaproteobacteria bacterium]
GTYQNAAGETKKRYQRIGSIIETKSGEMLKLDVIPLKEGGWDGWGSWGGWGRTRQPPRQGPAPAKAAARTTGLARRWVGR